MGGLPVASAAAWKPTFFGSRKKPLASMPQQRSESSQAPTVARKPLRVSKSMAFSPKRMRVLDEPTAMAPGGAMSLGFPVVARGGVGPPLMHQRRYSAL